MPRSKSGYQPVDGPARKATFRTRLPHSSLGGMAPAEFTTCPRQGHEDTEANLSAAWNGEQVSGHQRALSTDLAGEGAVSGWAGAGAMNAVSHGGEGKGNSYSKHELPCW